MSSSSSNDGLEMIAPPSDFEELSKEVVDNNVILYLVSQQADVNTRDDYGQTPLHYAAMRGNEAAAKDLLSCPLINTEVRALIVSL